MERVEPGRPPRGLVRRVVRGDVLGEEGSVLLRLAAPVGVLDDGAVQRGLVPSEQNDV